jgi:iron(III) transport system substrate-binding protein
LLVGLSIVAGCWAPAESEAVVYTALDREFSERILNDFTAQTGVVVRAHYDAESTKTVGLTERIVREAARPRCDVFWNNEIVQSIRLEKAGLLEAYHSPLDDEYPEMFRSPDGYWHGFAARARILIVNRRLVADDQMPDSIYDLTDPQWRGQIALAKPLFGTAATHAACLFAALGPEKAKQFFRDLKANDARVLSGNRQVADAVAAGELAFGLTDTDDAVGCIDAGHPVEIVYPDRSAGQLGVLFIPNTLCIVRGGPNGESARKLVDFLLSAEVEQKLAEGPGAQIPLNRNVASAPRVETPATVHAMQVDFAQAADRWEEVAEFLRDEFTAAH